MIENIKKALLDNNLELALNIILDNNEVYKDNIEFINLKGILGIKSGELEFAINNLKYALDLYKKNNELYITEGRNDLWVDISYNLAIAYEQNCNIDKAFSTYKYIIDRCGDENEKIEAKHATEKIKYLSKLKINEIYKKDNLIDENEYGKVKVRDLSYKEAPSIGDNIYEVRQNLNRLREDDNPLVSIYVLAYNNLEKYTKPCVESILKYTTDVDYELVLVDNGSSDGTYEYFKSVNYDKKKIIKINKNVGIGYQALNCFDELRGKYIVLLCNDTIVTQNWLSNMIKCAQSDPKVGMICPASDYISNLQSVDFEYDSLDDMQNKAKYNNISDSKKWNERLKLVTIATLFSRECIDMTGIFDYGYIHDYADDDISFRVRRAGYKVILCKDSFVSHRGRYTDKGLNVADLSMKKGRDFFKKKYFGVDSLDAMNYELQMLSLVDYKLLDDKIYNILGIDTLCGTPILEMKNKLRESGIFNTRLKSFSTEAKYWIDLNTICDDVVVDRIDYISEYYNDKFDYIVLGKSLNSYKDPYRLMDNMLDKIKDEGSILIKIKNTYGLEALLNILNDKLDRQNQTKVNISIEYLDEYLKENGFYISAISAEIENYGQQLDLYLDNLNIDYTNYENLKTKLSIKNYIVKIDSIKNKI